MQAAGKNPVNVVQELMAIHTNRKEAYEKMAGQATDDSLRNTMQEYVAQSERLIGALLNELSRFGDGVAAEVDMDNIFNNTWKEHVQHADSFNNKQVGELVNTLEQLLPEQYRKYAALNMEMPASTKELLEKQESELTQHSMTP